MDKQFINEQQEKLNIINLDKQWSFGVPVSIDKMSDLEKMKIIRNRKRQNQEKVKKFFGSDLKIDVSLNMIKRFKLPAIMESDLPLLYFICFLVKYQGVENLVLREKEKLITNYIFVFLFSSFAWKWKSSRKLNSRISIQRNHFLKEFLTLTWKTICQCKSTPTPK